MLPLPARRNLDLSLSLQYPVPGKPTADKLWNWRQKYDKRNGAGWIRGACTHREITHPLPWTILQLTAGPKGFILGLSLTAVIGWKCCFFRRCSIPRLSQDVTSWNQVCSHTGGRKLQCFVSAVLKNQELLHPRNKIPHPLPSYKQCISSVSCQNIHSPTPQWPKQKERSLQIAVLNQKWDWNCDCKHRRSFPTLLLRLLIYLYVIAVKILLDWEVFCLGMFLSWWWYWIMPDLHLRISLAQLQPHLSPKKHREHSSL